jgi:N-acetyltransferase
LKILKNAPEVGTPDHIPRARRVMAPSAAPAGHRPIHSFFRGVHAPCSTSTALPEAPAPAPAAPPPASVPAGSVPAWDRPNDRPVVAYARRRRGARSGDAASAGARNSARDAKRARVSDDRNGADRVVDEDEGEGRPGPSSSGPSADEGELGDDPDGGFTKKKESSFPRAKESGKTKQLFLDLGQKSFGHVTCATCGLLYAKGEREDEKTHEMYHARYVEEQGLAFRDEANSATVSKRTEKFGLACPKRWGFESAAWRSADDSEWVVVVGSRDHAKRRAVALKVAAHVEKTLGMKTGWAMCDAKCPASEKKKAFCYVAGDRVVGALVAEPLRGAFRTVLSGSSVDGGVGGVGVESVELRGEQKKPVEGSNVTRRGDQVERATLGVRALWTHPVWRRSGVASRLLDTARHCMTSGYVSGYEECAFTQPTEAGKTFAQKKCGREDGTFLVYAPE